MDDELVCWIWRALDCGAGAPDARAAVCGKLQSAGARAVARAVDGSAGGIWLSPDVDRRSGSFRMERRALGHSINAGRRGTDTLYQRAQPLDAAGSRPARARRAARNRAHGNDADAGAPAAQVPGRDLPGAAAANRDLLPKMRHACRGGGPSRMRTRVARELARGSSRTTASKLAG